MAVGTMRMAFDGSFASAHLLLHGWGEGDAYGLEDLIAHATRFTAQAEAFVLMLHLDPFQRLQVTQHVCPFR